MAVHRTWVLLLVLSALLTSTWALGKASLAGSAELDGSSESAVSAEPQIPGEEDATVASKRGLSVTNRLQIGLTLGERPAPIVTKRGKETRSRKGLTLKRRQNAPLQREGYKVSSREGSASGTVSGTLEHKLRGAGFASLGGKESLKNSGARDHCAKCPRGTWHTKGSTGGESRALLPRSFCPRKPKGYLASEAIAALAAAGYARTAKLLSASEILLSVNKPATLLVPADEAYDSVDVPRVDQDPSLGALMSLHVLEGMYSFEELFKSSDATFSTLHPTARLEAKVYQDGDFSSVTFRQTPQLPSAHPALIVKKDVFCNALVIVHVVNQVLEPPREATAQEEAPRDVATLKEMAGTVRDMDM